METDTEDYKEMKRIGDITCNIIGENMQTKLIEIRDRATFIPALAIKPHAGKEEERYLLSRAGYRTPEDYVLLMRLSDLRGEYDQHSWGDARTMPVIHQHLIDNWEDVLSGDVLDVEFILGETETPKESEAWDGIPF